MNRSGRGAGFTLVELIIVIAFLGIVLGIAWGALPRERLQITQAAEGLARTVEKARFDAIGHNNFVVLGVYDTGYCVLVVATRSVPFDRGLDVAALPASAADLDCEGGANLEVVTHVTFPSRETPEATLVASDGQGGVAVTPAILLVDPRGIGQVFDAAAGAITDGEMWVRVQHSSGFARDVAINRYGRTRIE